MFRNRQQVCVPQHGIHVRNINIALHKSAFMSSILHSFSLHVPMQEVEIGLCHQHRPMFPEYTLFRVPILAHLHRADDRHPELCVAVGSILALDLAG